MMMSHYQIAQLTDQRPDWVKSVMEDEHNREHITFTEILEKSSGGRPPKVYCVNELDSHVVVATMIIPEARSVLCDGH